MKSMAHYQNGPVEIIGCNGVGGVRSLEKIADKWCNVSLLGCNQQREKAKNTWRK
jgi:hypothetical protein